LRHPSNIAERHDGFDILGILGCDAFQGSEWPPSLRIGGRSMLGRRAEICRALRFGKPANRRIARLKP